MKVSLSKDVFIKSLSIINGIISNRTTLPILSNVLLETKGNDTLVVSSTDMEIGVSQHIKASVEEEGDITIPARKLLDIVKELPAKEVSLEITKTNAVYITSGSAFIKLIGLPKDDFPVFPDFSGKKGIQIDFNELKKCFRLTAFAISSDENKYVLNGMLLKFKEGVMEVVATDGRRLAYVNEKMEAAKGFDIQFIIPTKAVHELLRYQEEEEGSIEIIPLENQIVFKLDDGFVITRTIEGHFPDYQKVIPQNASLSSQIERDSFLSVLKRAYLLTSKESQGVKLDFLKNKILVSAKSPNLGELKEELPVTQDGEGVSVGFNPVFLIDVLKNLDDPSVHFDITAADKPGVVKTDNGNYLCVIMPMQIA